ncbi:hypothetical protein AB0J55_21930 [Amycolatopsis sp. NPDC049688]|uniref:hypothetical protein n=1 Tax=Amycolatopsis sp. NPDC049688 TaxID=3154733 RepID=UPI003431D770
MVIGALRDHAPRHHGELARLLAAASRVPGHRRIRLGPLGEGEVAELVRRETGKAPGPAAARDLHARTGGNPFYVRELSRSLAEGTGVPPTVHDIVRDSMTALDEDSRDLLRLAAFIGPEVGLDRLAEAAGLDVTTLLDRLEPLGTVGLLAPAPDDPFSFRFTPDLVRESIVETTTPAQRNRLHRRIGAGEGRDAPGPPRTARYEDQILPAATSARVTRRDL